MNKKLVMTLIFVAINSSHAAQFNNDDPAIATAVDHAQPTFNIHAVNPPTQKTAKEKKVTKDTTDMVQAVKGHIKVVTANIKTATDHIGSVATTAATQMKHLANSTQGQAVATTVNGIKDKTHQLVTLVHSAAGQKALQAHAAVEKQVNEQTTDAAKQSIKHTAQTYLQPHAHVMDMIQQQIQEIMMLVNSMINQDVLIAMLSDNNSKSEAIQNFATAVQPLIMYLNSPDMQQMIQQISMYFDQSK